MSAKNKSARGNVRTKKVGETISYRPPIELEPDLIDVLEVTRRSKASILTQGLEKLIPELKVQFAKELRALYARRNAEVAA